jgi:sorbitol-specific phosphotransferase system component IIC
MFKGGVADTQGDYFRLHRLVEQGPTMPVEIIVKVTIIHYFLFPSLSLFTLCAPCNYSWEHFSLMYELQNRKI